MSTKELVYSIGADYSKYHRETDPAIAKTRQFRTELAALEKQQRQHRAAITDLGQGMVIFGTAVVLGLGLATKAAISWESAFAGVRKTVDGSDAEIAALEGELRNLARTLPATHEEIAGVAEAAGQLGIKRKDIAEFTETMVALGETTNLSAEEAATALAKFSNIMGTSAADVDKLGSALVALGNDGASTEKDILELGLRIAAAGRQVGLTESQVLAFASSLSSVGIEAEAGGSSFSTAMIKMSVAARQGGDSLDLFAKVAGLTADQFATKFKQDAAGAIILFIQGLNRMQTAGGDVFGVLDQLGLSEIRVRDAMLRAAGASDMFTHSLSVGSAAWAENAALAEEAAKRYETDAARLKVSGNQIKDSLIDVGAAIAPVVADAAQGVADIARAFSELPGPVQDVVAIVGLAAAGITLVGGAALVAYPKILAFRASMAALVATGTGLGPALGRFGLFMAGPWGAGIAAGVTLLGLFAASSGSAARRQQELATAGKTVADAIKEQNGAINDAVRQVAAKQAGDQGLLRLARELGVEQGKVTDAILGQGDSYSGLITQLDAVIKAETSLVATRGGGLPILTEQGKAAQTLKDKLVGLHDETAKGVEANKDVAAASKGAATAQQQQAETTEQLAKKAKEAAEAFEQLVKHLNEVNGITLTAREAQRAYLEQLTETAETLKKNGEGLDDTTAKGRENAAALDAQAKAAGELAEAMAKEAEKQGGVNAGVAAFTASLEASRPALIAQAEAFGLSHEEAVAYANSVLSAAKGTEQFARTADAELARVASAIAAVPNAKSINVGVLSEEAKRKLAELGFKVETLPDGRVVVSAITDPAQAALNSLIARNQNRTIQLRAVITAYGPGYITGAGTILNALGGVVSFAGGGTWENHAPMVAQARPGTVRMWAEPDTGRESYIPWALDRRAKALGVLGYTADAFGYALQPKSQPAGSWSGSYNNSRSVEVATNFNGPVNFTDYESFIRADRARRAHDLFAAGIT